MEEKDVVYIWDLDCSLLCNSSGSWWQLSLFALCQIGIKDDPFYFDSLFCTSPFSFTHGIKTRPHIFFSFSFFKLLNQLPFAGREGGGGEFIDMNTSILKILFFSSLPGKKKKRFGTRHHQRLKFILCFFGSRFRFYFFLLPSNESPPPPSRISFDKYRSTLCSTQFDGRGRSFEKNSCFLVPIVQPKLIWNFIIFFFAFKFSFHMNNETNK